MRKTVTLFITLLSLGLFNINLPQSQAEENFANLYFNNVTMHINSKKDDSGEVYVEARKYFESIGFKVSWIEEERKVTVQRDNSEILIDIDQKNAIINGNQIEKPIQMINDTLFIPIVELSRSLGQKVVINDGSDEVHINNMEDPFREFEWETTDDEIRINSKGLKELTDFGYVIAYENYNLFNLTSHVYYHFKDRKLKEIAYRIQDKEGLLERFYKIRHELERKYGKPIYDHPQFINEDVYKSFVDQSKDKSSNEIVEIFYKMLTNGELSIGVEWKLEDFTVSLMLSNSGTTSKNVTYTDVSIRQKGFVFTGK